MPNAFATISFTKSVKAAQTRYGSRENNLGFELSDNPRNELGELETEFIKSRDSFYMATISENSWPYVQHRGGLVGFIKVLDDRTIGFADFKGNRQYLSVGNLNANPRISLILMDYQNRRRLKVWGIARVIHETDEPDLIAQLVVPDYQASVERGLIIQIEAIEWNCPQHITERYSEAEVDRALKPILEQNKLLREQLAQRNSSATNNMLKEPLGNGPLKLVVSGVRRLTPRIRAYELTDPDGNDLPVISAGSHLCLPVVLINGVLSSRNYSISSDPSNRKCFEVAVLLDDNSKGGSSFIHENYGIGLHLNCGTPRNDFALHEDSQPSILIAGGIGITPIRSIALFLKQERRSFQLHYVGRTAQDMAYVDDLKSELGKQLTLYTSQENRLDLELMMRNVSDKAIFYVCGPQRLIDEVKRVADKLAISDKRICFERFSNSLNINSQSIEVELRRSGKIIHVKPDETILNAIEASGVKMLSDCKVGHCGSCAVKVLEGLPHHHDTALTDRQRNEGKLICACVSRAYSSNLVLDV